MPRLEEFVTLCKVIEHKSFSRAAEILGLSQPAVSLQVKSLEADYGVKLLHRAGFEIVPTESGRVVYDIASQIVHLYEKSRQQARELSEKLNGELLIGASTGPGEYLLPVLLGQFKAHHPQVDLSLQIGASDEIIDQVIRYRLELGVVGISRRDRHLEFDPFIEDELVLVVHPEHPWAERVSVSYQDLLEAPLVLQQQGSGATAALYETLAEYDIDFGQLNVVMELGLQESTKAAVRSGMGVTIISRLGVVEELERGVLVEVPIEGVRLRRNFYVVYRRDSPLTNLAHAFLKYARQTVEDTVLQIKEVFGADSA